MKSSEFIIVLIIIDSEFFKKIYRRTVGSILLQI